MNTLLVSAIESGNFEVIKFLLERNTDLIINNEIFELAVINGNLEIVKFLSTSPSVNFKSDNYSIQMACAGGNLELVKFLLTLPDAKYKVNNCSVQWAIGSGHFEIVEFLLTLPYVDPTADNNQAIRTASERGHFEIVKLLEEAIQKRKNSQTNANTEIVKHLLKFDINTAILIAENNNLTEILEILKSR